MSVAVACGKCGKTIAVMKMLKPLKDVMRQYDGKCPSCGFALSSAEFTLDVEKG